MKTALYDAHCALKAKMVDFNGWQMPLSYQGIVQEHHAVRSRAGLFDISHMGRIRIEGKAAEELLEWLSTNHIAGKSDGTATYTVWCNNTGGCIDDLIVYKQNAQSFFVVVNAGNRQKDLTHLQQHAKGRQVTITDCYQDEGILALQGPQAAPILSSIFPQAISLKPMHFQSFPYLGKTVIVSRTGYTGADGFELYGDNDLTVSLWHQLLSVGKVHGLEPVGLGARDTLRLEMGYALYGHEIDDTIAPSESVSGWTVKWDKEDFLGKKALVHLENSQKKRGEYGVILMDRGIARRGYPVCIEGLPIGIVTSGTFSPSLNQAIAIVLVERNLQEGDSVEIQIREQFCKARVVALPFINMNFR